MKNKKRTSPYLIYSLFIHSALLLVIWSVAPQQAPLAPFKDEIEALITHVKPLQLPVKPLPFVEPADATVAEEIKPPPPPKPKAAASPTWHIAAQDAAALKTETRRQEGINRTREAGSGLSDSAVSSPTRYTPEKRLTTNAIAQPIVASATIPKTDYVQPRGETKPIALGADNALNGSGASPTVDAPKIHYGSQRGDALRADGVGNSWGGGSTSGGANIGGVFVYMMQDIARTLAAATTTDKVDIVFVLDETGSMADNIRGIRAYVDFLFDAMAREDRDPTFGLVTFRDKTKIYGRTDDLGTFKNWLSDIRVDGVETSPKQD